MSEWNLSVRLTGQGSSLSRTLRDTSRDARAASRDVNALRRDIDRLRAASRNNIRVRVGVDAARLRTDVRAALTSAGSGQRLRIRLGIDAGRLRTDVRTALTSAGSGQRLRIRLGVDASSLRTDVRTALAGAGAGQGLAVNLRLANAMQLRRDVADAVRWAAWGHRIEIPIGLRDPNQLRRDVSAAVRRAETGQTIRVRVTTDTSALRALRGTLGGGGGGGGDAGLGLRSMLMLAPAAIPLIAGLSSTMAPLAGQLTALGGAATAFGIAIAGQIGPLSEVADAEKKYQDAVREHGRSSKEAMQAQLAYQQMLAQLPPETQKAAVAVSQLKENFSSWSDDMSAFTMQPVIKGVTILDQLIPRLTPEVQSFSGHLDRLLNVAGGAISTPGFDSFADKMAKLTDQKVDEFTDEVIHLIRVVSEGDASGGALGQILSYARENGPEAREAIKAIGQAVVVLAEAGSQAGPTMLTLVTAAAKLVAALPPELVAIILQVATALKLLQLSGAGMSALASGIAAVSARITALTAVSTAAGGGLAGLRAAFMSLGIAARTMLIGSGIGILLVVLSQLSEMGKKTPADVDKLTTSMRQLASTGKASGEAARVFGEDLSGLADSLQKVKDPEGLDQIQQSIVSFFGTDSTPVKDAKKDIDALDKSLANLVKNGQADLAAAALEKITSKMKAQGFSTDDIKGQLDDYKSALADAAFEQQLAAESMGLFGQAAQDTQAKLDEQKASADGLRQSIQALNDVNRAAGGAMNAFEQSIDDAAKAAEKNAGALRMNHGELDQSSQKARDAESALRDLAANTDDAAAKAREQGKSWEYVQGIMDRGQATFIATAQKMGLTKAQATALAQSYLDIPDKKTTTFEMRKQDAERDLSAFNAQVAASPGSKSVTLHTLSSAAEEVLTSFGYKVTRLPDGSVTVSASTGQALSGIGSVAAAVARLSDRTITITTAYRIIGSPGGAVAYSKSSGHQFEADGGVVDYYANGGIQRGGVRRFAGGAENHVAQIAPGGSWRVWGEPETMGEGYVPFAPSKRVRSRAITEEIVRRLGGSPAGIQWNADGNVTSWRYDPNTGSLFSASDAGQAGHKTKKVKVKGKVKEVEYFDVTAVENKIKSASRATTAWNKDLAAVADRAGGDVAEALASMGEDGMKLAHKMATGSTRYINDMSAALRNLQKTARASLTDYTRQLGAANKVNQEFADDLAKLASMGYGDLAAQLAAQGDEAAQQLADTASKDSGKAAKANAQAKAANTALTSDELTELVQIIAAIRTNKTGIHQVAASTGLGEDEIIAVATKGGSQIRRSLGTRAEKFLADLTRANQHLSYADGGVRAGMYATSGGIIRFAEPETHGEALIPLGPNKRRSAMPVLADVARRFGVGLTDVASSRAVLVIREGGDTHVSVTAVRTGATASDIGSQVGRSVRRAKRGGVASRAGY